MFSQRAMARRSPLPSARLFLAVLLVLLFGLSACSNSASVAQVTITDYVNAATALPFQIQTVQASCTSGEQMVGGGFGIASNYNGTLDVAYPLSKYVVLGSYPSSATSWTVTFFNRTGGDVFVAVHVECASTSVGVQIAQSSDQGDNLSVTAHCPTQSHLTGGGFQVQGITNRNDVVTVKASQPSIQGSAGDDRTTRGLIAAKSPLNSFTLISYAVCATRMLLTHQGLTQFSAPAGQPDEATEGTAKASCNAGQLLTGGGYRVDDFDGNLPVSVFYPTYGTGSPYWYMEFESLPDATIEGSPINDGGTAYLYTICADVSP